MKTSRKLWLIGPAVGAALALSLILPPTRVLWARALIAVGSKDLKYWAFDKIKAVGPAAQPAALDLIFSEDFMPLNAEGQPDEVSDDEQAVIDWFKEQKGPGDELDAALVSLCAVKLRPLLGPGPWTLVQLQEFPALEDQLKFLAPIMAVTPLRGRTLRAAMESEDRHRVLAGMIYWLVRAEESGFPKPPGGDEVYDAGVRESLAEVVRSDPWPVNAHLAANALDACIVHGRSAEAAAGYVELIAEALDGSLGTIAPHEFDNLCRVTWFARKNPELARGALRALVREKRPRVAALAVFLLGARETEDDPEVREALLSGLTPDAHPLIRHVALGEARRVGISLDQASPAILAAMDPD